MNYRHGYHAGNFSDVFKHTILILLLKNISRKENAYCYIDTHAGVGLYDLHSDISQKSKEYKNGVSKILAANDPPEYVKHYIDLLKKINVGKKLSDLTYYPGSPFVAYHCMRVQDRMVLTELHKEEYQALRKNSRQFRRKISIHLMDSYEGLNAFLPPKERRGLILIDPPYEKPTEIKDLIAGILVAIKKFQTGIYAIWYPIKDYTLVQKFKRDIKKQISRPILCVELSIYRKDSPLHLNGCGILIINPPWQCEEALLDCLPWLWQTLSIEKQGGYAITLL